MWTKPKKKKCQTKFNQNKFLFTRPSQYLCFIDENKCFSTDQQHPRLVSGLCETGDDDDGGKRNTVLTMSHAHTHTHTHTKHTHIYTIHTHTHKPTQYTHTQHTYHWWNPRHTEPSLKYWTESATKYFAGASLPAYSMPSSHRTCSKSLFHFGIFCCCYCLGKKGI